MQPPMTQYEKDKQAYDNWSMKWAIIIFTLPITLIAIACSTLAHVLARKGLKYSAVKLLSVPSAWIVANFAAGVALMPVVFFLAGYTDKEYYTFAAILEVAGMEIWGPWLAYVWNYTDDFSPRYTERSTMIVWQVLVWIVLGHRLMRHFALTVFDPAVVVRARREGIHPYDMREKIAAEEPSYMKDSNYYMKDNRYPLLAAFTVMLTATNVDDFYFGPEEISDEEEDDEITSGFAFD